MCRKYFSQLINYRGARFREGAVPFPDGVCLPPPPQQPASHARHFAENAGEDPAVLGVGLLDAGALAVEDVGDAASRAPRLLLLPVLPAEVAEHERGEEHQEADRLPLVEAGPLADLRGHRRLMTAEDMAED